MCDQEKPEEVGESMSAPSPPFLEGEISDTGWEVKMTRQDDTRVWFRVYCKDEDREWFKIDIRCSKKKFRRVGV